MNSRTHGTCAQFDNQQTLLEENLICFFHVPETVGFEKKGVDIDERDLQIANNLLRIEHPRVHRNKDIHELLFCYVHIKIAKDAEGGLDMYIKLLDLLSRDGFLI